MKAWLLAAAAMVAMASAGCASQKACIGEKVAVVPLTQALAAAWAESVPGFDYDMTKRWREESFYDDEALLARGTADWLRRNGFNADVYDEPSDGVSAVVIIGPGHCYTNIDGCLFAGFSSTEIEVQVRVLRGVELVHDMKYTGHGAIIVPQPFATFYGMAGGQPGAVPERDARKAVIRASGPDVVLALGRREEAASP